MSSLFTTYPLLLCLSLFQAGAIHIGALQAEETNAFTRADDPRLGLIDNAKMAQKYPKSLPRHDFTNGHDAAIAYPWEAFDFKDPDIFASRQVVDTTKGKPMIMIVHPLIPDEPENKAIGRAIADLAQIHQKQGHPTYVIFWNLLQTINAHFSHPEFASAHVYVGPDGHHQISFPNADRIVVAGGNLQACLCTAIYHLTQSKQKSYQLDFPLQAIYQNKALADAQIIRHGTRTQGQDWQKILSADLDDISQTEAFVSLIDFYRWLGPDEFRRWAVAEIFKDRGPKRRICLPEELRKHVQIVVQMDGRTVEKRGSGRHTMTLNLITLDRTSTSSNGGTGTGADSSQPQFGHSQP